MFGQAHVSQFTETKLFSDHDQGGYPATPFNPAAGAANQYLENHLHQDPSDDPVFCGARGVRFLHARLSNSVKAQVGLGCSVSLFVWSWDGGSLPEHLSQHDVVWPVLELQGPGVAVPWRLKGMFE